MVIPAKRGSARALGISTDAFRYVFLLMRDERKNEEDTMNLSTKHLNTSHYYLTQIILLVGVVSFLLWSSSAQALVNVTCPGQSLQAAINGNDPIIDFTGTCNEDIVIVNFVDILGDGPSTAIVNGDFRVFSGLPFLDNFKITNTGANDSILFLDRSRIRAYRCDSHLQ
jgi:hypothetical protein